MKFSVVSSVLALTPAVMADWKIAKNREIEYSSVEGFFMQDNTTTDAAAFDYVSWARPRSIARLELTTPGRLELWPLEPHLHQRP